MAKFRFDSSFDWHPQGREKRAIRQVVHYKAGLEATVTRKCAEEAEAAGAGEWLDKEGKSDERPEPISEAGDNQSFEG